MSFVGVHRNGLGGHLLEGQHHEVGVDVALVDLVQDDAPDPPQGAATAPRGPRAC